MLLSLVIDVFCLGYEYGKKQGMGGGRSYFSMEQLQELELQALIFRHIISGATIPPQLLHLLITNKSFILSSLSSPYYQNQLPLQHYHPACKFPVATLVFFFLVNYMISISFINIVPYHYYEILDFLYN